MDNSLQEIAGSFTFSGMKNKLLSIFALALLPASMAVPQVASAYTHCVGNECEVSLTYTGSYQTYSPPANATNFRFEVYGAAGGRGGAGGVVRGTFTEVPEAMFIFVGEAGGMGSGIDGGFNGGGASGGNSGTEGAGGGATDIRLSLNLESRIVVAGGGGGGGGEAGGNGGHGGTEFAAHGGSGQASGGGGATQTEGGFAGVSNGGFQAGTPGQLGLGGSGGFSTFAGGGGGGGGYYGGGGGGADDNTCCSDGGGGGGGSSFADTNFVTDVSHQAGVSWGHGWVTFRYTLVPSISYFDLIQVSNQRAVFTIEATEDFVGLEPGELIVSGEGCEISELTVEGALAYGAITGCSDGEVALTLAAGSFGQGSLGPVSAETVTLQFDAQAPVFEYQLAELQTSLSDIAIPFSVTDQLNLQPEMFAIEGCALLEVGNSELVLSSCSEGVGSVALLPNTLVDSWQNTGPETALTLSFTIDQTAPTALWSEVTVSESGPFSYSAILRFSEDVLVENLALAFASSAQCESSHEVLADHLIASASCGHSTINWSITARITDGAGNATELRDFSIGASNLAPVEQPAPVPVYVPVIVEVPVAPIAIEQPKPTQSPVVTQPPSVSEPVSESEVAERASESIVVATPKLDSPVLESAEPQVVEASEPEIVETVEVIAIEVTEEPAAEAKPEPEVVETQEPELAQAVIGPELELEETTFPWLPILLVLGLGVLGFGAWRFSGR